VNERHLKSFMHCAKSSSFSAAAQSLYISTNSLIQQINLFEKEVGFKLFNRSSQGISLTDKGKEFYKEAGVFLNDWDSLIKKHRDDPIEKKVLRTCFLPGRRMLFLEELPGSFFKDFEDISFEFVSAGVNWVDALIDGTVDYLILPDSPTLNEKPLYIEPLCVMEAYCVVSPAHPLAQKKEILLPELKDYPILLNSADWIDVFPFLRKHPKTIDFAYDLTDVYTKCLTNSIYLLPKQWAVKQSSFRAIPLSPTIELQILLIARDSDFDRVKDLFGFFKTRWQEISKGFTH